MRMTSPISALTSSELTKAYQVTNALGTLLWLDTSATVGARSGSTLNKEFLIPLLQCVCLFMFILAMLCYSAIESTVERAAKKELQRSYGTVRFKKNPLQTIEKRLKPELRVVSGASDQTRCNGIEFPVNTGGASKPLSFAHPTNPVRVCPPVGCPGVATHASRRHIVGVHCGTIFVGS